MGTGGRVGTVTTGIVVGGTVMAGSVGTVTPVGTVGTVTGKGGSVTSGRLTGGRATGGSDTGGRVTPGPDPDPEPPPVDAPPLTGPPGVCAETVAPALAGAPGRPERGWGTLATGTGVVGALPLPTALRKERFAPSGLATVAASPSSTAPSSTATPATRTPVGTFLRSRLMVSRSFTMSSPSFRC